MLRLIVLAALLFALPAHADTFYVDSEIDDIDALPGDGVCATAIGACTLRAAIQETNALPGEDAIDVPAGNFVLAIPGIDEDAAATGDLDITDDLVLTGANLDETIIDAAGIDRVLDLFRPFCSMGCSPPRVELSGVTVTGGEAGGIYVGSASGSYYGTELWIFDSTVEDNSGGPGIYGRWGILTIEASTIQGNSAGGVGHGGDGPLTIRDSVITENSGVGVSSSESRLLVERTAITNNFSETGTGGIYFGHHNGQILNSTIAGNESGSGTGGILTTGGYSDLTIINTTISGNVGVEGGGVAVRTSYPTLRLSNSTIVGNSAQRGGGINGSDAYYPHQIQIKNVILAKNSASLGGPDCYTAFDLPLERIPSGGHNILGDASDCAFESSTGDQIGTAESPIDPKIGPLADNGGPTQTHALLAGSPAIDAIPVADCTYDDDVPLTEDQRGVPRPQGEACDIGAYEAMSCDDGIDNDRDGYIDWNGGPMGEPADPGCADADDLSERSPLFACDDGADNDGDGKTDFDPFTFANPGDETTPPSGSGDPACFGPAAAMEDPQCQDGINNDPAQDDLIDYDGGQSIWGYCTGGSGGCPANVSDPEDDGVANPDPQCVGTPWKNREARPSSCGLGIELALLLPPLMWMWRRRRS